MSALLLSLLSSLWPYILAGIAALAALWKAHSMGAASEKAKQARKEQEARDIRDKVDNDIGSMPADQARKDLSRWDM